MSDSSSRRTRGKATPEKPRPDFPLGIHRGSGYWCRKVQRILVPQSAADTGAAKCSGYWCRKVRGRVHYFGKVADDPKGVAALKEWLRVKDDLSAGRGPRAKAEGVTVAALCNHFLAQKKALRDNGEIQPASFREYYIVCADVVAAFGETRLASDLAPSDFEKLRAVFASKAGPTRLGRGCRLTRENGLLH